jgi:Asp/Glu/hydantoin racemase
MTRIFAVHTATALIEPITALFKEHLPDVKLNHIADDSLIQEVIANGKVTPMVKKRMLSYYYAAVDAGADYIFNTCSSVGDVADNANLFLPIPVIRIDEQMALKAVELSGKIGVIATLPTTLEPTANLLKKIAFQKGKAITIVEGLAAGAFEAGMSGDRHRHDALILEASQKIASQVDVIVLAQGSMARMEQQLAKESGKIVLSSPLLGVLGLKNLL